MAAPRTEAGRLRALANLKQFRKILDQHGAYAVRPNDVETRDLVNRLRLLLGQDGMLRPQDDPALEVLAVTLRQIERLSAYLGKHGPVKPSGEVRPALDMLTRLVREARETLEALGATPRARAKLGLDVARGATLAEALARMDADQPAEAEVRTDAAEAE